MKLCSHWPSIVYNLWAAQMIHCNSERNLKLHKILFNFGWFGLITKLSSVFSKQLKVWKGFLFWFRLFVIGILIEHILYQSKLHHEYFQKQLKIENFLSCHQNMKLLKYLFFILLWKTYPNVSNFLTRIHCRTTVLKRELTSYDGVTWKTYTGSSQGQHTLLKTLPTARYNDLSLGNSWFVVRIRYNADECKWLTLV